MIESVLYSGYVLSIERCVYRDGWTFNGFYPGFVDEVFLRLNIKPTIITQDFKKCTFKSSIIVVKDRKKTGFGMQAIIHWK